MFNLIFFCVGSSQALRHEMRRLPRRNQSVGPGAKGERQGFPPELFHLPGLSKTDEHW